jgi:hypothetical protein
LKKGSALTHFDYAPFGKLRASQCKTLGNQAEEIRAEEIRKE